MCELKSLNGYLEQLNKLKVINTRLSEINECLTNNDCSASVKNCAQFHCKINTDLIESFNLNGNTVNKSIKCIWPKCNYEANCKSGLDKHIVIHTNERKFICDYNDCNQTFAQKSGLISHKNSVHLKERRFVCNSGICNKRFISKRDLIRHKRIHSGEKPYKCDVNDCGKRFQRCDILKIHQDDFHLKIRYRCDYKDCNQTFAHKNNLQYHIKSVHLKERLFVCEFVKCIKRFSTKSQLNGHKRIHTGENPHKCDVNDCAKRFN